MRVKRILLIGLLVTACGGGGPEVENCTEAVTAIDAEVSEGATASEIDKRWTETLERLAGEATARDALAEAEICQSALVQISFGVIEESLGD